MAEPPPDPHAADGPLVQAARMDALAALVAGVEHELNNSLAAIVSYSQLIARDPGLPDDLRTDVELFIAEADRTRRIVLGLLDLARRRPRTVQRTAPAALVEAALEPLRPLLTARRVALDVDVPASLPPVAVDPGEVRQALLHLLLAAIDTAATGGRLSIDGTVDQPDRALDGIVRLRLRRAQTDDPPARGDDRGLTAARVLLETNGAVLHAPTGDGAVVVDLPPAAPDPG